MISFSARISLPESVRVKYLQLYDKVLFSYMRVHDVSARNKQLPLFIKHVPFAYVAFQFVTL